MFNKKKDKKVESVKKASSRNVLGKGTSFKGDVTSDGDFRIDGIFEGNIKTSGRVILGQSGKINGNVECSNADIEGEFTGEFIVKNILNVKSTAVINGEVFVSQIATETGATINAKCSTRGKVKDLKSKNEKTKDQKTA